MANSSASSTPSSHTDLLEPMCIFKSVLQKQLTGCAPTHLKIFVAGETGEGKSTLINSIVESEVAETDIGSTACTTE